MKAMENNLYKMMDNGSTPQYVAEGCTSHAIKKKWKTKITVFGRHGYRTMDGHQKEMSDEDFKIGKTNIKHMAIYIK